MRKLTWRRPSRAALVPLAAGLAQLCLGQAALAQARPAEALAQAEPVAAPVFAQGNIGNINDFYGDAQALLQEQVTLADRVERAMSGPDPNAVRAVDGQIVIHSGKVDRFLAIHYPVVQPRCGDPTVVVNNAAVAAQDAVTCSIRQNAQSFAGLQAKLFARLNMLSGIAEVNALPLVSGENTVETGGIPVFKRGSLQQPARSRVTTAPDLPAAEASILGRPGKSAIADYSPPIPPAITAPPEVISTLEAIQSRIEAARQALPNLSPQAVRFSNLRLSQLGTNPATLIAAADAQTYDVTPSERLQHQTFLRDPHSGITRVLTRRDYEPDPNVLRNRLEPTLGDRYPYALLVEPGDPPLPDLSVALRDRLAPVDTQRFPFVPLGQTSFAPRLAMQLDGGQLKLQHDGLDYGFMVDLGQLKGVALNEISAGLEPDAVNLRSDLREFFLSYRVPDQLEQLLLDRRRFLSAKAGPGNLPTLLAPQAAVSLGHTYLLRTVQFDAPEALTQGTPVTPAQRRNLDEALAMPGKDLLVVFQPVAAKPNGSYTLLWRVLGEFPVPEMTDAADYATFEQRTIVNR